MDEIYRLGWPFLAGAGIGLLYFSGLWLTVRLVVGTQQPLLLTFLSFGVRVFLAVVAFYLVMRADVGRLIASLFGFLAVRMGLLVYWHRAQVRWEASDAVTERVE